MTQRTGTSVRADPEWSEVLDGRNTPLGDLLLQRRAVPSLGPEAVAIEVHLDHQMLMSSLVNQAEIALADLGLAPLAGRPLDVLVGGLGLGHTAAAALAHPDVASLLVVEYLDDVIRWHRTGLVPLGESLCADPRCRILHEDFFGLVARDAGLDPENPERRFDAILVDIDHSPDSVLDGPARGFYAPDGLRRLLPSLRPGGVFALWSFEPPAAAFLDSLAAVFPRHEVHEVAFDNPIGGYEDTNTIYVARAP